MVFTLASCGENKLVGSWICPERNSHPQALTLYEDGTGVVDGHSVSWWVDEEENKLGFAGIGSLDYYFEGDTLYIEDYAYTRND